MGGQGALLNLPPLSILSDNDKIAWYDYKFGVEHTNGAIIRWRDMNNLTGGVLEKTLDFKVGTPHLDADGVLLAKGESLSSSIFTVVNQPVFIYTLFKRIVSTEGEIIIGAASGLLNLYTWGASGNLMAAAGNWNNLQYVGLTNNTWHVLRLYFNGANSKLIIDNNAPITGDFGNSTLNKILIGTSDSKFKTIIYRKSDVGESQIYKYLKSIKTLETQIDAFKAAYTSKTMNDNNQLNVVISGDSIFGRQYMSQISPTVGEIPPNMYQQIVAYKVLQKLQYSDADVHYKSMDFWTRSGSWAQSFPTADDLKLWQTNVIGDYAELTITGSSYFKFIYYTWLGSGDNQLSITFNGQTPAQLGLTGVNSFTTPQGTPKSNFYKWANIVWSGLDPTTAYVVRITNIGTQASQVWGAEYWSKPRINVIVSAHGGYTAAEHKAYEQNFFGAMYNPNLNIHELACLNDSYTAGATLGGKSPASASVAATSGQFIFALSGGTFTNYSGLVLTLGQYAEYNGSAWVKGSTWVTTALSAFDTNISYIIDILNSGIPTIYLIPHPTPLQANTPWLSVMKNKLRAKIASINGLLLDMEAQYTSHGWIIADAVADGTHLNDLGVQHYFDVINTVI